MLPDGKAGLADLDQRQIERVLRALEHRGKGDIERQPLRLQLAAGVFGLGDPLIREIGILPAGKEVLQIPFALAMTHKYEKSVAHSFDSVQIWFFVLARFFTRTGIHFARKRSRSHQARARRSSNTFRASDCAPTARP